MPPESKLAGYLELLAEANEHVNLIGDPPERWPDRHLADARQLAGLPGPLIDVGSGAGLPGLVLAILDPELEVTLVESVGRKADFLERAAERLALDRVRVLRRRAEELGQDPHHRETYESGVCRGLARPATALELVLPLVRVEGSAHFYLGAEDAERFGELEAIGLLGGELAALRRYRLPGETAERCLAEVRKRSSTPAQYPRRTGVPKKRPLGQA